MQDRAALLSSIRRPTFVVFRLFRFMDTVIALLNRAIYTVVTIIHASIYKYYRSSILDSVLIPFAHLRKQIYHLTNFTVLRKRVNA